MTETTTETTTEPEPWRTIWVTADDLPRAAEALALLVRANECGGVYLVATPTPPGEAPDYGWDGLPSYHIGHVEAVQRDEVCDCFWCGPCARFNMEWRGLPVPDGRECDWDCRYCAKRRDA